MQYYEFEITYIEGNLQHDVTHRGIISANNIDDIIPELCSYFKTTPHEIDKIVITALVKDNIMLFNDSEILSTIRKDLDR